MSFSPPPVLCSHSYFVFAELQERPHVRIRPEPVPLSGHRGVPVQNEVHPSLSIGILFEEDTDTRHACTVEGGVKKRLVFALVASAIGGCVAAPPGGAWLWSVSKRRAIYMFDPEFHVRSFCRSSESIRVPSGRSTGRAARVQALQ